MNARIFMNGGSQAVRLPKDYRLPGKTVSIRRVGDGILLEPIKENIWPEGYFDRIRIDDPDFRRPDQGVTPSTPFLGS